MVNKKVPVLTVETTNSLYISSLNGDLDDYVVGNEFESIILSMGSFDEWFVDVCVNDDNAQIELGRSGWFVLYRDDSQGFIDVNGSLVVSDGDHHISCHTTTSDAEKHPSHITFIGLLKHLPSYRTLRSYDE